MPEEKTQLLLLRQAQPLFEGSDGAALRQLLGEQRSSDIAEIVELLDREQIRMVFNVLDKPVAAEVLEKVEEATRRKVFELLADHELRTIIIELDLDDAADLLAELSEQEREELLKTISPAQSQRIRKLMSYSEDSAGGIMDPVVISVNVDATVSEAVNKIRSAEIDEDFFSVYIVDDSGRFLGDVRIRLLVTSPEETRINTLVDPDTIYVITDDDQERVRNIFSKNDLIVVPVLDKNHRLVGRITADRIIEVAEQEAAEDIFTMAGTDADELDTVSTIRAARVRMT